MPPRPIRMTSFAFILGLAVLSGMPGVTLFGILFTAAFYVVIRRPGPRQGGPRARREAMPQACEDLATSGAARPPLLPIGPNSSGG
jgi:hypothetical protein